MEIFLAQQTRDNHSVIIGDCELFFGFRGILRGIRHPKLSLSKSGETVPIEGRAIVFEDPKHITVQRNLRKWIRNHSSWRHDWVKVASSERLQELISPFLSPKTDD